MSDGLNPEELLQEFNQEQQSQGEDSDLEIEVKGRKLKASQIEEWEKGHLRQEDYTRKTQELAAQRKQHQSELQQLQQYQQIAATIQQRDPSLFQLIQRTASGQPTNDPYSEDPYAQAIRQQQAQIQGISAFQQELATKQNLIEIETELATLEKQYPKMDRDTVLAAIAVDPETDMETLAKASHDKMTQRVRAELQQMAEERKSQRRALTEGSGGRTAGVTKPVALPKSREEMEKVVAERLKQLGGI